MSAAKTAAPTKEQVSTLLTKYGVAYKAGDTKTLEAIRADVHALTGATDPKTKEKN